jgi:hypothetical protein
MTQRERSNTVGDFVVLGAALAIAALGLVAVVVALDLWSLWQR